MSDPADPAPSADLAGQAGALEGELVDLLAIARGQQAHLRQALTDVIGLLDRPASA